MKAFVCWYVSESHKQTVVQADASARAELDEERRRYQSLLREFTRLEQRYDNLRDMSLFTTNEVHLGWKWLRGHLKDVSISFIHSDFCRSIYVCSFTAFTWTPANRFDCIFGVSFTRHHTVLQLARFPFTRGGQEDQRDVAHWQETLERWTPSG